jgi:penicillin amidase
MIIIVLVLVFIATVSGGYWFITSSFPQIDGTLRVQGVQAQVEIVRDSMGVPHIYAQNADDLFFAQGYVQAQDRLWQMELNRRTGRGTLSEIFGSATIEQDRMLRTLGLRRAAEADVQVLDADTRHVLQVYANGVNAFIETHRDRLPIEFTILGFQPAPWEPLDTVVWGKVMSLALSHQMEYEIARQMFAEKIGETKASELLLPYPANGPFIIPPEAKKYADQQLPIAESLNFSIGNPDMVAISDLLNSLGASGPEIGSNDWVIGGARTTTGKPIVASDQHLSIQMPSIWYDVGLHCVTQNDACPYSVAGVTFPGTPGVVVGHNDRIAWGVTNVGPDTQDLFIEKINPSNANQYDYQGKWQDFQIAHEVIKVKGGADQILDVQISRHGPIMTPVLKGITQPLALQWTSLRDRGAITRSMLMLDRAKNWNEFREALKYWDSPSQNFVYADTDGNIGYQMPGLIPIRAQGNGLVPVPGWTGEYEWSSYIPFDELPMVLNPPTNFIATANNAVVPSSYKYHLSYYWASPYRAQRIVDLIQAKEKLSIDDVKAMQGDVYSIPLAELHKYILAIQPRGFLEERAMERVKTWDGRLTTNTIGGAIVEVTYQKLARNLFADKFNDKDALNAYLGAGDYSRRMVLDLLTKPESDWWKPSTRDEVLRKSYTEAVDWLGSQYGDDPGEWKWSRLHTATFAHPIGSVQPLDRLFNLGPIGVPGGVFTVFSTSHKGTPSYATSSVTSQRQIIDLGNFSNSVTIHTTGQSGQPLNKHYGDMVLMWRDVQYAPYYFDRAAVDKAKEGRLILSPN